MSNVPVLTSQECFDGIQVVTLMTDRPINILVSAVNVLNFTKIINNYKRSLFQYGSQLHAKTKFALWCV